jgi:hypothetical protein
MLATVAARRLRRQHITGPGLRGPADVVRWCGAMQAQEYEPAKWAIGLRMRGIGGNAAVERAFADGRLLRTHVMRPTWHFVTPADIRWLLELTGPRVHRAMAPYRRHLELDERTLSRGTAVIERSLGAEGCLTRQEIAERLGRHGLSSMSGPRLAHLAMYAELEGVICSGPRRDGLFTYALVAERAPQARRLSGDEALATLTRRFFRSHGPATTRDFAWWSGLTAAHALRGLEMNGAQREEIGRRTYWTVDREPDGTREQDIVELLPIYDEYIVAYRDREAVPHGSATVRNASGAAIIFQHALVIAGQVAGTWRVARKGGGTFVRVTPLRTLRRLERRALVQAVERYQRFLSAPVEWTVDAPAGSG